MQLTRSRDYDVCPVCGQPKRTKSKTCAGCRGYGRRRHIRPDGYVRIWAPGHPAANADGYAQEHRYIAHEAGLDVPAGCHVHHINGDRADNRIENLEIVEASEHHRRHIQEAGFVVNQYGIWPLKRNRCS